MLSSVSRLSDRQLESQLDDLVSNGLDMVLACPRLVLDMFFKLLSDSLVQIQLQRSGLGCAAIRILNTLWIGKLADPDRTS